MPQALRPPPLWFWLMSGLGAASFVSGLAFPVHTDIDAARDLKLNACGSPADGASYPEVVPDFYDRLDALGTLRHPLMQGGISLVLSAAAILVLLRLFPGTGPLGLRTPDKRWQFFALGTGVLALSWFSQMASLVIDQQRGSFPWCADSIPVPMVYLTAGYLLLGLASVAVGAMIALFMNDLPQDLLVWRSDRPFESAATSIPFALLAGVIAFVGIAGATSSSFVGTPAVVVALYVVEAARSAVVGALQRSPEPA